MTTQISQFIDGKRTAGPSTRTAAVMHPSTGEVQAKVPLASAADVDAAVAGAAEAQKQWAAWNPQRRATPTTHLVRSDRLLVRCAGIFFRRGCFQGRRTFMPDSAGSRINSLAIDDLRPP